MLNQNEFTVYVLFYNLSFPINSKSWTLLHTLCLYNVSSSGEHLGCYHFLLSWTSCDKSVHMQGVGPSYSHLAKYYY